jgi:hypothetical protein
MTEAVSAPPRRWRRRLILIGLVVGISWSIFAFRASQSSSPLKLPDPNGYDDLVRAGRSRMGDWPNKGDLAKAKMDEIRPFVEANQKCLELARVGLSRECLVPIEDTQDGLSNHFEASGRVRDVTRIFGLKARVLEADGRVSEAAEILGEVLELGQVATQGGMASDAQMGWVVQEIAIGRLRNLRDKLSVEDCKAILRDLDSLDHRRVTEKALLDRWARWYQGSFHPLTRTMMKWNGIEAVGRSDNSGIVRKSRDQIERAMHYYQVELAIHLFHEKKKAWPRSLQDLVPAYLASVPLDSNTGKPLEYPANPAGGLTNDLSAIARPDGEVKPQP